MAARRPECQAYRRERQLLRPSHAGASEHVRPDSPLVIVSNRGPKDFVWKTNRWVPVNASGGLVSMLAPLARRSDVSWFCCVSEPPDAINSSPGLYTTAADQEGGRLRVVPIALPASWYQDYYGRISNEVLWMLQHRVLGAGGFERVDADRHRAWNDGYVRANSCLAAALTASCPFARAFLVQDYHLYPLPALLRASLPRAPILHFTHIPFPDAPVLRLLPRSWRDTILKGLLGADVVGFQTLGDVYAFQNCCAELIGASVDDANGSVIADDGRTVTVRAYPASVDPQSLNRTMRSAAVEAARIRIRPEMGELNIIRVDRLDPSKNQLLGFLAFARLLETRPDLRGRVRFLAFLVPSRTDLDVYRNYADAIHESIDSINRRFADECGGSPPIIEFYTNDRDQALAAMESCDVLLINSLQDGMNLVAKEWAINSKRPGVLIVSETAGVANEAADSGLLVSPLDIEGTAVALARALDMPEQERHDRLARFRHRVEQWTARTWLSTQLQDLEAATASH
jgi:trehalose 6-phosphate synthase